MCRGTGLLERGLRQQRWHSPAGCRSGLSGQVLRSAAPFVPALSLAVPGWTSTQELAPQTRAPQLHSAGAGTTAEVALQASRTRRLWGLCSAPSCPIGGESPLENLGMVFVGYLWYVCMGSRVLYFNSTPLFVVIRG